MRTLEKKYNSGFTLIELSIVIGISAFLIIALMRILTVYRAEWEHQQAKKSVLNAQTNLASFYDAYGRYPCPADPAILPGAANYGEEDCSIGSTDGARDTNGANGRTDDQVLIGIFPVYALLRDESGNPITVTGNSSGRVYLNEFTEANEITNTNTIDPWGSRLKYAVTQVLTRKGSFDRYRGAIQVVDEFGRDTGGTKENAHYFIASHGPNRLGARDAKSGFLTTCNAAYTLEARNCGTQPIFTSGLRSQSSETANQAQYFDDYVAFDITMPAALWSENQSGGVLQTVNTGMVGIKKVPDSTVANLKLDVGGTVKADRITYAQQICNESGSKCLNPQTITNIKCLNDNEYLKDVQIASNGNLTPVCAQMAFPYVTVPACTGSTFLRLIRTDGTRECSNVYGAP